jgi:hypothetical protein
MTMWQKALVIKSDTYCGKQLWVKSQPPHFASNPFNVITGVRKKPGPRMFVSIKPRSNENIPVVISPERIELLPEFAEDVPLISWDDFLKGDAMAKGGFQR